MQSFQRAEYSYNRRTVNYPGNSSLAAPVKDRVVSTFQQTLTLYKQGRKDEVAAGCSLILQMDPMFDPAKKLLEKTRNPSLPIDIDALLPSDSRAPIEQAREAMAARDFQRVIQVTSDILTDDLMNEEARVLGDEAREKLEAGPFIEQFVRKCDQNLAAGNLAQAKADLEKARALDPAHPEVVRVTQSIAARQTGATPAVQSSPSFVVDDSAKQATGRAASHAADFGFTFEEEKAPDTGFSNFSFDSPSDSPFGGSFGAPSGEPPKAPVTGEFDFSTASVATSPDDQKKIEQYLADGDRAYEAAEYQQAIDLWSRIFLIDVTNDQASERIERAKAKRREIEQKVDALVASGLGAMERKDHARARADFAEAQRLDPNNATLQEYMNRVADTVTEGGAAAAEQPYIPPPMEDDKIDLDFFEDELPVGAEAPLVPPSPAQAAAAAPAAKKSEPIAKAKPKAPRKPLPVGAILAVLGILAVVAGGWFAWTKFFKKPEVVTAASEGVINRAKMLAGRGRYDEAIALLREIKTDDPQHDTALVMIADLQAKKTGSAAMINGKPAEQYYAEKLAAARAAFDLHDYATAKAAFEEAQRVKALPADAKAQYDTAADQVAKLDAAKKLFTEQRYEEAIANLQPLLQQDPQNTNVQRMIVDSHFNLGAKALQEERTADAVAKFDEVLKVNPNDELARRSRELALRYDKQRKDLLYQIYVKYLPLRTAT